MAGFTLSDALSKFLFAHINMGQLMLVRGVIASSLVILLAWARGAFAEPGSLLHPMVLGRVAADVAATVTFFVALAAMPLPNVSAIMQALPLAVTAGAALVFAEPVGWRRWSAIGVGFLGVLAIVRPGAEGFTTASLWVLACVAFCAARDLATKRIPSDIPSLAVSSVTAVAVTIVGGAMMVPLGGWRPLEPAHLGLIAIAAVLLLFGYQFVIMAMRTGDVSAIAPFRYTSLLWALALGWLVFGHIPDAVTLAGSAVVVLSGLYMLWREARLRAQAPSAAAALALSPERI